MNRLVRTELLKLRATRTIVAGNVERGRGSHEAGNGGSRGSR